MNRSLQFGFLATVLTLAILYGISLTKILTGFDIKEIAVFGVLFFPITSFVHHRLKNR